MAIDGVGFDSKETVQEFIDRIKGETTRLQDDIGNLEDLETRAHNDLVFAINEVNAKVEQLSGNYIIQRTRLDNLSSAGTGTLSGQGFTRAYEEYSDPADIALSKSILDFDEIEVECNDSLHWTAARVTNYTSTARTIIRLSPMVSSSGYSYLKEMARTVRTNSSGDITTTAKNEYWIAFTANNVLSVSPMIYGKADSDSEDSYYPQLSAVFKVWGIKYTQVQFE